MASAEMRMWVRVRGQWRLRVASVLAPALPFRWRVAVARWAVRGMVMELRSASGRVVSREALGDRYARELVSFDG
jgi:hypothetical protein